MRSRLRLPLAAQSDAFGESLLGCGAALLELSAEDELILEGALLAARAFFDGPAAGKTPHVAPKAGGEGWHQDAKTGNEELGARSLSALSVCLRSLRSCVAPGVQGAA